MTAEVSTLVLLRCHHHDRRNVSSVVAASPQPVISSTYVVAPRKTPLLKSHGMGKSFEDFCNPGSVVP